MIGIRSIIAGVLLAGGSVLVACGDPLGPADIAGDFVMTRVGSTRIPGTVRVNEQLVQFIEYDSVSLRADGTARTAQRVQLRFGPEEVPTLAVYADEWVYEIQAPLGRLKLIQPPCRPFAPCNLLARDPIYFTLSGGDLVREAEIGQPRAVWSRRDPTAAQ